MESPCLFGDAPGGSQRFYNNDIVSGWHRFL